MGLKNKIFCFNVESYQELTVINELASSLGLVQNIAIRVNPNVEVHSHKNITTGKIENKFGISVKETYRIIEEEIAKGKFGNVKFIGIHFHIGSQILNLNDYNNLISLINEMNERISKTIQFDFIDVGGGLGVDYEKPIDNIMPKFKEYFSLFEGIKRKEYQKIHFELGRSLVAQCGILVTKVLYVKKGETKTFIVVDSGFTELIRPALYQAKHEIINLTNLKNSNEKIKCDIVGPICESTDTFRTDYYIDKDTKRGDLLGILSVGAYGEVMASCYNCRELVKGYLDDEIN